ncbi:hypothetical protein KY289_037053 [Solanum tuberosum]|nr:hypothetical protein KY289_037053 [Solanum tuberosum]
MSSVPPDYNKLPVEQVTVSRPSYSLPEDPFLCEAEFFKETSVTLFTLEFISFVLFPPYKNKY